MSRTVDIGQDVKDALKKFRFGRQKGNAAISIKIVKSSLTMAVDEQWDNTTIEDIAEELPENAPRYVILLHEVKHKDGRVNYPLILINWTPSGSPVELMTLHASSLSYFQQVAEVGKVLEVREGAESLTQEAVEEKLLQN